MIRNVLETLALWSGWREENLPEHPNSSPFICKTSELKYMKK